MQPKKQLDELLNKQMDRKDFLKHVALGAAVISGAAGVIKMVNPTGSSSTGTQQSAATTPASHAVSSYGGSPYGGVRAATRRIKRV